MKFRALLVGVALTALAGPAIAQDKVVQLKLSHWVPATHPLQKAMEEWGASVEKASGGTIKSTVFPPSSSARRSITTTWRATALSNLPMSTPATSPVAFPIIAAGEIPFLVGDVHGGIRAIDTWYRKYAPTEMKDVKYCFSFILDPATWHSRSKKIVVPADIKGMKVRPSNATIATWVTQLGGTNVQASASEVRDVMEKGVAEAVMFPWGSVPLLGRRQGHQVRHGRGDFDHHVPVGDEPEDLRRHVAGAEEGDRRPLHHRMGRQVRRSVGRFRACRYRQGESDAGPRGLSDHQRTARRVEESQPSRCARCGPTTCARPAAIRTRS